MYVNITTPWPSDVRRNWHVLFFIYLFFLLNTWLFSVHADSYAKTQRVSVKILYLDTGYIIPGLK
jgi:hypothetical protein